MREIKFRAWSEKLSKMLDVVSIHWLYKQIMWFDGRIFIVEPFSEITLMQFTGLKDKSGKEIYEGDVVANHEDDNFVVEYSIGSYWCVGYSNGNPIIDMFEPFMLNGPTRDSEQLEVIGNLYENKDLLAD